MKDSFLTSTIKQFEYYKTLAERAVENIGDEQFFWQWYGHWGNQPTTGTLSLSHRTDRSHRQDAEGRRLDKSFNS